MPGGFTRRHCLRSGLAALITLPVASTAPPTGDRRLFGVWRFSRGSDGDTLTTLLTLKPDGTFAAVTAGTAGYAMTGSGSYRAAVGILRLTLTQWYPQPDNPGRGFHPELWGAARYEFRGRDKLLICADGGPLLLRRIR